MAESWKTTKEMADYFAISVQTLRKRWGGPGGFLVEGEHWRAGPHLSPRPSGPFTCQCVALKTFDLIRYRI